MWLPGGYISSVMCRDHDWQPLHTAHVTRDCPGPGPMCWHCPDPRVSMGFSGVKGLIDRVIFAKQSYSVDGWEI